MNVYEHHFMTTRGTRLPLDRFRGQPILLVNIASESRQAPQLQKLQQLWENYRHFGLVIVGLPSNDFGAAEPLRNDQIEPECRQRFGVRFPLTIKQKMTGRRVNPLFTELQETYGRDILPRWNFYKFLFDQGGRLAERWSHRTEPDDTAITHQVERNLKAWII
jgi:glutathione peroxidase